MAKRILIIDDERDMQVYLATLFKKAGYETTVAASGDQGVQLARELRPDLITLDVLMPHESGVTAYESLRQAPETRAIPVVVVTGMDQLDGLFAGSESLPPPDAVVEKPIDREAFLQRVGELLGGPD